MGKSKAKRKAQAASIDVLSSKKSKTSATSTITPPPDSSLLSTTTTTTNSSPETIHSLGLHPDDLTLTIDTLTTLTAHPTVLKSRACKDLRASIHAFRQACTTGFNAASEDANLTSRISGALADGGYFEARVLLAEMRVRGQRPKLGALCRWVRDLDVVSGLAEQVLCGEGEECGRLGKKVGGRTEREVVLLGVLDAVLRVAGPVDYTSEEGSVFRGEGIILRKQWDLRGGDHERRMIYKSVLDKSAFKSAPEDLKSRFRVIETTPGPQRKPANLHPAVLYASKDDSILLSPTAPTTTHHTHPTVPNLHLMKDVLSPDECTQIIVAAESIGFIPDAPIREVGEESSILAHNFYWLVDTAFCDKLWSRVQQFVPESVGGKKVQGLNRRFRVYRYVPGAEYRAHIDGAWPPSGLDATTDTYIYDASPPGAAHSSLFTFLIYLNDEFAGGETTFFLPSARDGHLNAYPVRPVQGSVVLFPHGETVGSLLHEGTGVRDGGKEGEGERTAERSAKYVIRTDVLYDVGGL